MFLATEAGEFLIIAIIGVIVIAVALLIYFIISNKNKKKQQINIEPNFETKNLEVNQEVTSPVVNQEVNNLEEKIEEPIEVANEVSNDVIPNNVELTPEQKAEDEKTDSNIQTLLDQMQSDLNNKAIETYQESINRYEDDEEANAIISYKELMKYKESLEKSVVLEEKDKEEIKEVIKDQKEEPKEEVKKFKRSEFISPIFGYNEEPNITYHEIKRPPRKEVKMPDSEKEWESDRMLKNLEDSSAEVMDFNDNAKTEENIEDENDKFLNTLVDFRRNLD